MSRDRGNETPVTIDEATRFRLTVGQVGAVVAGIVAAAGAVLAVQAQLTTITDRLSGTPDNPGLSQRIKVVEELERTDIERLNAVDRKCAEFQSRIDLLQGRLDSDQQVNKHLLDLLREIKGNQQRSVPANPRRTSTEEQPQ